MATFGERLAELGFATYRDYLRSPHWLAFRARYKSSGRRMTCIVCGIKPIELHHHTYKRLGNERLDDVTPVCRLHHEAIHVWLRVNGKPSVAFTREAIGSLSGKSRKTKRKQHVAWPILGTKSHEKMLAEQEERLRQLQEIAPLMKELEAYRELGLVNNRRWKAARQLQDRALIENYIKKAKARAAQSIIEKPPKRDQSPRLPRVSIPFAPNAKADPGQGSARWRRFIQAFIQSRKDGHSSPGLDSQTSAARSVCGRRRRSTRP